MNVAAKKTKSKIYFKINNEIFVDGKKVDLNTLQIQQVQAINSAYGWELLGDFETLEQAEEHFKTILNKRANEAKIESIKNRELIENKYISDFKELEKLDVIPTTYENVKKVLNYLNMSNWGSWRLPKMTIGYRVAQHDCGGRIVSTMTLDKPISCEDYGVKNETRFKTHIGGGYLNKYQSV